MASYERVTHLDTRELMRRLIENLMTLVDRQIALAKVELRENLVETGRGMATLAVGAVFAILALTSLVVAGILALATAMPGWLAALTACAILGIAAAVALLIGKDELQHVARQPLVRTRETLREDVEWAKHRLTSNEK